MGWKALFGKAASLAVGTPFAGFFVQEGFGALKTLFPGQPKNNLVRGGGEALDLSLSAGSSLNVIPLRQQIPAICGTHVATPAAVAPAYTEMVDGFGIDTFQVFAFQGPTRWKKTIINGALSSSFTSEELEIETREGLDGDAPLTLVDKNVFEDIFDETLPDFKTEPGSPNVVHSQDPPTDSKPTWITHGSKPGGDEIWVDLDFPSGLNRAGSALNLTAILGRMRLKGTTAWRNLPEMRIRGNFGNHRRFRIKFVFAADPGGLNTADFNDYTFPAIIFNHLRDAFLNYQSSTWTADPYFGPAEGIASAPGGQLTEHYNASDNVCTFYLDPADPSNPFPKGEYEFGFKRGYGGRTSNPIGNINTYHEVEGTTGTWLISDNGTRTIPENSAIVWHSLSTVRNESPVNADGYALLAVRARDMELTSITAEVAGLTDDLVDGAWVPLQETSNVASWARRLRTEPRLAYAMPDEIRADVDFEAWHAKGKTFNMVIENNMTISALFGIMCEAGYAHPRYGATEGVWLDFDRSGDEITGVLTPHNSINFSARKPMDEVPEAFAIGWHDATQNYEPGAERVRYRSGVSAATVNLKRQSLVSPGKVLQADVDEWGDRKLAEMAERTTAYQLEIDWEHLQHDVGDLLGLAWNTLGLQYQSGVVESVVTSGDLVTGLRLRAKLAISEVLGDVWSNANPWLEVNAWTDVDAVGLGIRYDDGTVAKHEITNTTDSRDIVFTTPFAVPAANPAIVPTVDVWALASIWTTVLKPGTLVWAGPLNSEEKRVILTAVEGADDMRARLTLVDEAPSIHP